MILNITTYFLLSSQIRAGPQIKTGAGPPARAGPVKSVRISIQLKLYIFLNNVRRSTMRYFKNLKATGIIFALVMFAAATQTAMAAGTASNTTIANTAAVDYQISGAAQPTVTSNNLQFLVDNRVDLTVTSVLGDNVVPSEADQPLTFTITNDGNTTQGYSLAATNRAAGDNFDMTNIRIYIEDGTTAGFQIAEDTLYVAAANAFDLAADATSVNVYVVSDTPGTPTNGQTSDLDLRATTLNAGTTVVTTATAGADTAAVDVVFGDIAGTATGDTARDGTHSATGTYTVAVTPLTLVKSSAVTWDPFNLGVDPKRIPGAIIRYTLVVNNPGASGATNVVVVDGMPANTTYVAASITVGGAGRTDVVDGDNADYNVTNVTSVTVNVGALGAAATETITFDVTIN